MRGARAFIAGAALMHLHLGPAVAVSAAEPSSGSDCSSIASPKGRLACFDRIFPRTAPEAKAAKPQQATAPKPLPIDIKAASYCDIKKLYSELSAAAAPKTQFETTTEYEARQAKQVQEAGIQTNNVFCEATPPHLIAYNADTKEVKIYRLGPKGVRNEVEKGSYTGQNAYGASATIIKSMEEIWELKLPYMSSDVFVSMPPDQAKIELQDLRFAMVGDISKPYVSRYEYESTPTIRDPRDKTTVTFSVHYTPKQFMLYNDKTKEIRWSSGIVSCKDYPYSSTTTLKIGKC